MSYIPYTWVSGELITVDKLNNMESGASEVVERLQSVQEEINRATAEAIESIPKDYTVMDQEIKKLKAKDSRYAVCFANSLTASKSGIGQVTIGDAWEAPVVEMEIGGVSEQVVTTGAQLFDAKKIQAYQYAVIDNVSDNGRIIKVTGSMSYAAAAYRIPIDLVAGKTVTTSGKVVSKTVSSAIVSIQAVITLEDDKKIYHNISSGEKKISIPNDIKQLSIGLHVNNSDTDLETPNTAVFSDVMVNVGDTALPWEPYSGGVPSPSPEWPQEIKSVGDGVSLEVTARGENLLPYPYTQQSTTTKGITFTANDVGGVKIKGTSDGEYATFAIIEDFLLPPGKYRKNVADAGVYFNIARFLRRTHGYDRQEVGSGTTVFNTAEWDYKTYIYEVRLQVADVGTKVDTVFYPMICAGETLLPWEPYHCKTITIPLSKPLRGIGDVRDRIAYKDGDWGIERQFVKLNFNGAENWEKSSTEIADKYRFLNRDIKNVVKQEKTPNEPIKILADKLKVGSSGNTFRRIECISSSVSGEIYIYLDAFSSEDANAFKTYLAEHPINAIFERTEPLWEPFPDATQTILNSLTTYPDTTIILTPNAPNTSLTVTYVQDTRKVVSALELDMAEQITELQAQIDQLKVTNNL